VHLNTGLHKVLENEQSALIDSKWHRIVLILFQVHLFGVIYMGTFYISIYISVI